MSQNPSAEPHSWHRRRFSEIAVGQWQRWLDPANRPSPYLLPEWGRFWERVWPNARAEVWFVGDTIESALGVSTVRRRRCGFEWVFAQPLGTPGMWLGRTPSAEEGLVQLGGLIPSFGTRNTVQVAITIDGQTPAVTGWRGTILKPDAWILDLRDRHDAAIPLRLSDSHRRNIEKGARHKPVISFVGDREASKRLLAAWLLPASHRSRVVLNPRLAPAFAAEFSQSGAMRWRTAWIGARPVATSLWLVLHDRAVYVDGAFDRDPQFTGVSHHLFAEVLTELYKEGVRHFDFGAGPQGESPAGLRQFKEGWGGSACSRTEVIYRRPWFHWLRRAI